MFALHYFTFEQVIDITDGTDNNTDNTTGKYEILLTYRLQKDNTTDIYRDANMTFYIYTYNEYTQINDQPTLDNIVPLDSDNTDYYKRFAYYYSNSGTSTAKPNDGTNKSKETSFYYATKEEQEIDRTKLLFPTITFNPEHYLLTINRVLYKTTETIRMSFATNPANTSGTLTMWKESNGVTTALPSITLTPDATTKKYQCTITLDSVGEYTISKTFIRYDRIADNNASRVYEQISPQNVEYRFKDSDPNNNTQNITLPEYLAFNGYQTFYTPKYGETKVLYDNTTDSGVVYSPNYGYRTDLITTKPKPSDTTTTPSNDDTTNDDTTEGDTTNDNTTKYDTTEVTKFLNKIQRKRR